MAEKTPGSRNGCESEETSKPPPAVETEVQKRPVAPVREKIGEERGNLRQRSDWFRKRFGDS